MILQNTKQNNHAATRKGDKNKPYLYAMRKRMRYL